MVRLLFRVPGKRPVVSRYAPRPGGRFPPRRPSGCAAVSRGAWTESPPAWSENPAVPRDGAAEKLGRFSGAADFRGNSPIRRDRRPRHSRATVQVRWVLPVSQDHDDGRQDTDEPSACTCPESMSAFHILQFSRRRIVPGGETKVPNAVPSRVGPSGLSREPRRGRAIVRDSPRRSFSGGS